VGVSADSGPGISRKAADSRVLARPDQVVQVAREPLQTLRLLNTPKEKLRLVLNRANSKAKLDVSEVERTLQVNADALIPSDVVVPQAVNKGVPVVLAAPRSSVTKALEDLADLFLPAEVGKRRRR